MFKNKFSVVLASITIASLGMIALSGCTDSRVRESEEAKVEPYQSENPNIAVEVNKDRDKPTTSQTPESLVSQGTVNMDYETNIVLDVPEKEYKLWEGKTSDKVIVKFVRGTETEAPKLEALMSGTVEVTLTNTETKEEYKFTTTVVYK